MITLNSIPTWACVEIRQLELQVLFTLYPEWKKLPAALIDKDKSQGKILMCNQFASAKGIKPGMRYAKALGVWHDLRAAEVKNSTIKKKRKEIIELLQRFSPEVEASEENGIFWINTKGLELLFKEIRAWAHSIIDLLHKNGFASSIAVSFSRFGSYAIAKSNAGVDILRSQEEENQKLARISLYLLNLKHSFLTEMEKLGIETIGEFSKLPEEELIRNYGESAKNLIQILKAGENEKRLSPENIKEEITRSISLDDIVNDYRILFQRIKPLVNEILKQLENKKLYLKNLKLELTLDDYSLMHIKIEPAKASREETIIFDLLELKLSSLNLKAGIRNALIKAESLILKPSLKKGLFEEKSKRDLDSALRSLARIRAEFGEDSVKIAEISSSHLPEELFSWRSNIELSMPQAIMTKKRPLIRRFYEKPKNLMQLKQKDFKVEGPFAISAKWWNEKSTKRVYYHLKNQKLESFWVYYDQKNKKWYLHARC